MSRLLQRIFKASLAAMVALGIASAAFGENLGEIAGTAVVEGKPLNNVMVRLRNVDNGQLAGNGFTNDDGEFRFTGLPVGNYVVETVAPNGTMLGTSTRMSPTAGSAGASRGIVTVVAVGAGVADAPGTAAGGAFLATTAGIAATPGNSTDVASLEKPGGIANLGEIAGTAVVEGKPLANVTVRLRNVDNGQLGGNGFTNDDGEFRFTGLPVGNYVVETVAPNGTMLGTSTRMSPTAGSAGASRGIVTVVAVGAGVADAPGTAAGGAFLATTAGIAATPGNSTDVASLEKPGGIANLGEIAGTAVVEGKPLANVTVRLRNVDNGQLGGNGFTNDDGEFRFTGLPVGNYVVETVAPNGTMLGTSARMSPTAGAAGAGAAGAGAAGASGRTIDIVTPAKKPLAVIGGGDPINPWARGSGFPGRDTDLPGSVMIPSLPRPDMGRFPAGPAGPSLPGAGRR